MPIPENITLQMAVNGGVQQTGGIVVQPGDSVVLSVTDTAGVTKLRYELTDYPPDWPAPSGWSADDEGVYYTITAGQAAPAIVTGDRTLWGKYLPRVVANDGLRDKEPVDDLVDEKSGFQVLSAYGLKDIAYRETSQFDKRRQWVGALRYNLRAVNGRGGDAFSSVTVSFVQPAVGSNVTVQVLQNDWIVVGQYVFVETGGDYEVVSKTDDGSTVIKNVGSAENASPGTTIPPGKISPSGAPGLSGTPAFSTVTASFTQPAVGASVTVTMAATQWIESGVGVYIAGAGYYMAGTPSDTTHCPLTLTAPSTAIPTGGTVASGSGIGPAGPIPAVTSPGHVLQLDANNQPIWGPLPTAEAINSFTTTVTLLEAGATLTNPSFAATYNQTPTSASNIDNQGGSSQAISSPFTSFSYTGTYTKTAVASVTWTLTAVRIGSGTATRAVSASWGFRVYRGAAAAVTTAANIQALAHNTLTTTRVIANYSAESTGSNYDWFAAPSSFGTPTFTDASTNLAVPFDKTGTVSVTNANGVATNYDIWRSHFAGIGNAGTIVIKIT